MTEAFLSRWSRLKARRQAETPPAPAESEAAVLPRLEDLTIDSDFRPFLGRDVPPGLRRQALRRLWSLDPHFSQIDGMDDYAGDYTAAAKGAGLVASAYRIGCDALGRGMPDEEEEEPPDDPPEQGSAQV